MRIDLSTTYLGLKLANPLVVSACPITEKVDSLQRLEQAGAAAAVLPSLFEEQIEHEEQELRRVCEWGLDSSPEARGYFPDLDDYNVGPKGYLRRVAAAKRAVSIPVIASLNGVTRGGWTRYAGLLEETGVDALELNVHRVPTDPRKSAWDVEREIVELVGEVCQAVDLPVAVKVGPHFTSLPHLAPRLVAAGAKGLVLFNRFVQPDLDLSTLEVVPNLVLSSSLESRLPLMWIAILRDQVGVSLGATSGIHTRDDVVKLLLAGSDAVLLTSALYRHGPDHLSTLREGLRVWLDEHDYDSVAQMKGSLSRAHCATPNFYERVNYMKTLVSYTSAFDASF